MRNMKERKTSKNYVLKSFLPSSVNCRTCLVQVYKTEIADLDEFCNAVDTPEQLYKPYLYGNNNSFVQTSRMPMWF